MAENQPTHDLSEEWRPIPEYEGIYAVSNSGQVKSLERVVPHKTTGTKTVRERILKPVTMNHGYQAVTLWKDHAYKHRTIHSLVAEAFLGPRPEDQEVCHNNGVRHDNRLDNLRYGTRSENALDRNGHGTNHLKNKTHCIRGHRLEDPNLVSYRKRKGHRNCLACSKAYDHMRYHKIDKSQFQRISDEYLEKILSTAQAE